MSTETTRYCKNCKHYRHTPSEKIDVPFYGVVFIKEHHKCLRNISPVTGEVVERDCELERDFNCSGCTKEGRYFEPKEEIRK